MFSIGVKVKLIDINYFIIIINSIISYLLSMNASHMIPIHIDAPLDLT